MRTLTCSKIICPLSGAAELRRDNKPLSALVNLQWKLFVLALRVADVHYNSAVPDVDTRETQRRR